MASGHKRQAKQTSGIPAPKKPKQELPLATLYVKNLNDKVSITDLRTSLYMLFSLCGHVVAINAHKSPKMRGQAHIAFANIESATAALAQFQGRMFLGKPIEIAQAKQQSIRLQWLERESQV